MNFFSKSTLLFASVGMFLFSACSKEQITANKLDGTWVLKSHSITGGTGSSTELLAGQLTLVFDDCKLNKGDCMGGAIWVGTDGAVDGNMFLYTIEDDYQLKATWHDDPTYPNKIVYFDGDYTVSDVDSKELKIVGSNNGSSTINMYTFSKEAK